MSAKIKRRLRIAAVVVALLALSVPIAWLAAPQLLMVDTGISPGSGLAASGSSRVGAIIVLGGELWTRPQRAAEVYWEVAGEKRKADDGKGTTGPRTTDHGQGKPATFNVQPRADAPIVVVTGEGDCEDVRRLLEARDVPSGQILTECESTSTFENAKFSVELLREQGVSNAVIVTSWFHSRRARACFRDAAPEINFLSCPTARPPSKSWWPDAYERKRLSTEYVKLVYYWLVHGVTPFGGG